MIGRERRRAPRCAPRDGTPLLRVRLRAGRELVVIDLSPAGALVEGETRLLPGTHVDVHVITATGRLLVRSRVVRAYVSALAHDGLRYRGALAFERFIDFGTGYSIPAPAAEAPPALGSRYPAPTA